MNAEKSPILNIKYLLGKAPFRILPENAGKLYQWISLEDISLNIYTDEFLDSVNRCFYVSVETSTNKIHTNVQTLEYLWSCIQFHYAFYVEHTKAYSGYSDNFLEIACKQLGMAETNIVKGEYNNIWRDSLLLPSLEGHDDQLWDSIQEIFLCAFAWIIHHELSHIKLGHGKLVISKSIKDEEDADIRACENVVPDSREEGRTKRIMGIVSGILAILELPEKTTSNSTIRTHQETYHRLNYCLDHFSLEENHKVYHYVSSILLFYLSARGVNTENIDSSGSYRETYSNILLEIRNLTKAT